jgi:predicted  nucleic acid-binding Zn-ribbon protein
LSDLQQQIENLQEQNEDLRHFTSHLQEENENLRHFTFYEQQRLESSLQYMTEAKYKAEVMTKDIMDTVEMTELELSVCNKNYDELLNFSKTMLNNILKKYKN